MAEKYINEFKSELLVAVADTDDPASLTLNMDSADFPADLETGDWRVRLTNEIMLVTAVDVNGANPILTANRAVEDIGGVAATPKNHGIGAKVIHIITAGSLETIINEALVNNDAVEINYDNTDSELVADNVQTALDEIDSNLDNLAAENVAVDPGMVGRFHGRVIPAVPAWDYTSSGSADNTGFWPWDWGTVADPGGNLGPQNAGSFGMVYMGSNIVPFPEADWADHFTIGRSVVITPLTGPLINRPISGIVTYVQPGTNNPYFEFNPNDLFNRDDWNYYAETPDWLATQIDLPEIPGVDDPIENAQQAFTYLDSEKARLYNDNIFSGQQVIGGVKPPRSGKGRRWKIGNDYLVLNKPDPEGSWKNWLLTTDAGIYVTHNNSTEFSYDYNRAYLRIDDNYTSFITPDGSSTKKSWWIGKLVRFTCDAESVVWEGTITAEINQNYGATNEVKELEIYLNNSQKLAVGILEWQHAWQGYLGGEIGINGVAHSGTLEVGEATGFGHWLKTDADPQTAGDFVVSYDRETDTTTASYNGIELATVNDVTGVPQTRYFQPTTTPLTFTGYPQNSQFINIAPINDVNSYDLDGWWAGNNGERLTIPAVYESHVLRVSGAFVVSEHSAVTGWSHDVTFGFWLNNTGMGWGTPPGCYITAHPGGDQTMLPGLFQTTIPFSWTFVPDVDNDNRESGLLTYYINGSWYGDTPQNWWVGQSATVWIEQLTIEIIDGLT